jgi:hypothetical protein
MGLWLRMQNDRLLTRPRLLARDHGERTMTTAGAAMTPEATTDLGEIIKRAQQREHLLNMLANLEARRRPRNRIDPARTE